VTKILKHKNTKNILQKTECNQHGPRNRKIILTVRNYCAAINEGTKYLGSYSRDIYETQTVTVLITRIYMLSTQPEILRCCSLQPETYDAVHYSPKHTMLFTTARKIRCCSLQPERYDAVHYSPKHTMLFTTTRNIRCCSLQPEIYDAVHYSPKHPPSYLRRFQSTSPYTTF
jgi:hypothetical protein